MFDSHRNITYTLTHQIGAAIIRGSYSADKIFPTEAELSSEFNISRTVTREAIKMLTAKGLLVSRPRRGISVMPVERWNMFDPDVLAWTLNVRPALNLLKEFTQLRITVEPEAARLAAENCNENGKMEAIRFALQKIEYRNSLPNVNEFLLADVDFHTAILSASNNSYFLQMSQFVKIAMRANIENANQLKGSVFSNYYSLKKIFDEINAGNGCAAADSVRELLNVVMMVVNESVTASNEKIVDSL